MHVFWITLDAYRRCLTSGSFILQGQVIAGLNCAVFWHNLEFNEVQMTALFKNEDGEMRLVRYSGIYRYH